jgi:hypothetical protein
VLGQLRRLRQRNGRQRQKGSAKHERRLSHQAQRSTARSNQSHELGVLRKALAQCLVLHTTDGELASRQSHEQGLIVWVEEIAGGFSRRTLTVAAPIGLS